MRSASIVRFASVVLAEKAASSVSVRSRAASPAPSPRHAVSGTSSSNVTTPDVSVPVLSVQRTSTLLRLSMALNCCTSTSLPSRRTAPSAYVSAMLSTSPLGMSARITVDMRTLSTNGTSTRTLRTQTSVSNAMTTMSRMRTICTTCLCSGVSSRLNSLALAVSLLAKLSSPTARAS